MKKSLLLTCAILLLNVSCSTNDDPRTYYNINIENNNELGTIICSKLKALKNEKIEINIEENEGYKIEKLFLDDTLLEEMYFIMPDHDVTLKTQYIEGTYEINIEANEYGLLETDKSFAKMGETVKISFDNKSTYKIENLYVNEEIIDGFEFTMPGKDITISASYINSIKDTNNSLTVYGGGVEATSYWYFNYLDNGIQIDVDVIDRYICDSKYKSDPGYRDNIEFILSKNGNTSGYDIENTIKVLISCDNDFYFQKANTSSSWSPSFYPPSNDFNSTTSICKKENNDGYDGYKVSCFVSYNILNTTKEEILNNLRINFASRNSMFNNATNWKYFDYFGSNWEDIATFPILKENNILEN